MRIPRLRLSLAALFVLAAVLGPGAGLAWRWRQERERTAVIRMVAEGLKRIKAVELESVEESELDSAEDELKRLYFLAENAPDLTAMEREGLILQLRTDIDNFRQESGARIRRERRGCYPSKN